MNNLFEDLESNNAQKVEEFKSKLKEQFNATKDSWILNGIYDYYLSTSSSRAVDIMVAVKEPHDKHFFDRMLEGVRGNNKLRHLTLLGHIVRRKPIWLYKIFHHQLFKELLKILKVETDIVLVVSVLLILNILIPTIPHLLGTFLQEIFIVFSKLAAMNSNSNNYHDVQLVHLQISLYTLFHRLYGMFPSNFISFLRKEYSTTENLPVFNHTVKPMLETMRINPVLITTSEKWEVTPQRWKNVESHDIMVSCAKLLMNGGGYANPDHPTNYHESRTTFKCEDLLDALKISGNQTVNEYCKQLSKVSEDVTNSSPSARYQETVKYIESTPTMIPLTPIARGFEVSSPYSEHEGSSPPETAIEATPETTPVRDPIMLSPAILTSNRLPFKENMQAKVPTDRSYPNSPIKKESSPFSEFSYINLNSFNSQPLRKINALLIDRNQINVEDQVEMKTVIRNPCFSSERNVELANDKKELSSSCVEANVSKLEFRNELAIAEAAEDFEGCEIEKSGSPCSSGGLHMPDNKSLSNFAIHMKHIRIRHYSQSNSDSERFSPGNSPQDRINYFKDAKVRRTNSCPEMKKNSPNHAMSDCTVPEEQDKELKIGAHEFKTTSEDNMVQAISRRKVKKGSKQVCIGVQTDDIPLVNFPYEHLFLDVFPAIYPSLAPNRVSPMESENSLEEQSSSIYEKAHTPSKILQKYIDASVQCYNDKVNLRENSGKNTLQLENKFLVNELRLLRLQLQMEEHRKEVHAERNRRLLGRSRRNKTLEEHNNALKDQVLLLQKQIEINDRDIAKIVAEKESHIFQEQKNASFWQGQYVTLRREQQNLTNRLANVEAELKEEKDKNIYNQKLLQENKATLTDITNELKAYQKDALEAKQLRYAVAGLQAEVLKSGEMIVRYRTRIEEIGIPNNSDAEKEIVTSAYLEEVKKLNRIIDDQQISLEAFKEQVKMLKNDIAEKEKKVSVLKEALKAARDDEQNEIKELKNKYEEMRDNYSKEKERANDLSFKLTHAKRVTKLSFASQPARNSMDYSTTVKLSAAHDLENKDGTRKSILTVPKSPKKIDIHSEEYQSSLSKKPYAESVEKEPQLPERRPEEFLKGNRKKIKMECAESGHLRPLHNALMEEPSSTSTKKT